MLAETAKNDTLLCPLCKGVFRDPHIATCGVSPSLTNTHYHVLPLTYALTQCLSGHGQSVECTVCFGCTCTSIHLSVQLSRLLMFLVCPQHSFCRPCLQGKSGECVWWKQLSVIVPSSLYYLSPPPPPPSLPLPIPPSPPPPPPPPFPFLSFVPSLTATHRSLSS